MTTLALSDFRGKMYCLIRLGFDLSFASSIRRSIVNVVISQDDQIRKVTSVYINDLYITEDVTSATSVAELLL